MTTRAEQRERTRGRIVEAAIEAFAANGFDGSATRDIAARAGVTQGLVTYHFESKVELWQAAADRLFGDVAAALPVEIEAGASAPAGTREAIRAYVRLSARRPEIFHFMVDAGRADDDRMRWLVDTHVHRWFTKVARLAGTADDAAHLYYALAGAASLLFAVGPEVQALTGVEVTDTETVERHADFVARLFVP